MKVCDISNYDYDQDITNPDGWVAALQAAGVEAVIIGSQDMGKARWQVERCKAGGLPIIATYAEPDVTTAISLAGVAGCSTVCIVIEPGGIQDVQLLRSGIADVRAAGLVPVLYGNRGDVLATAGLPEFQAIPLWFASYFDDHRVITSVDWWPELWGHQFTSTEYIAGKNRDISEVFTEDTDMTPEQVAKLERGEAAYQALTGGFPGIVEWWVTQGYALLPGYLGHDQNDQRLEGTLGDRVKQLEARITIPGVASDQ